MPAKRVLAPSVTDQEAEKRRRHAEDEELIAATKQRTTEILRAAGYDVFSPPVVLGVDRQHSLMHVRVINVTLPISLVKP